MHRTFLNKLENDILSSILFNFNDKNEIFPLKREKLMKIVKFSKFFSKHSILRFCSAFELLP